MSLSSSLDYALSWIKNSFAHFWGPYDATNLLKKQLFSDSSNPLAKIFERLNGYTLVIQDIKSLSPRWVMTVNPHLESVRAEYNEWVRL